MKNSKWTVESVKSYAIKHYEEGFDWVIECSSDEEIEEHIKNGSIWSWMTGGAAVMNDYREAARYFSGEPEGGWVEENEEENISSVETTEDYYSSATGRDYSPSNPWDAPGMSVRDFI